jgi:hypothetical protein
MSTDFDLEVARRLPLADAALQLLQFATNPEFLDQVFQRHRGRSYERDISFPLLVRLITEALLGHRGSAHQTFQHAREDETLSATIDAAYKKLSRVPIALSLGFFSDVAERLRSVVSASVVDPLPTTLADFWVLGFDGKKIKYVAKRLKPLRGLNGNIFGGKLLVVQDLATGHAVAVQAVADGEAADNPLAPEAIERVRNSEDSRARLWVSDRAFCAYELLHLLATAPDHFVVRYKMNCKFYVDSREKTQTGIDDEGRSYRDEIGWLGGPKDPHRIAVRKITAERGKDQPFSIVTSLHDRERYSAKELLTLYRRRWGIETMFQQVVQTFELRHLIGSTPEATVFQAMLCMLLYNITLMIRDSVARGAKTEARGISMQLLFDDVIRDLTGWIEVIGVEGSLELLKATRGLTAAELRRYLDERLGKVWTKRWRKSPTRKRPPKKGPHAYLSGGHGSVDRIQSGAHKEIPYETASPKNRANPPPSEASKHV